MKMLNVLLRFAVIAMSIYLAMAANYTVGGSNRRWNQATDYKTWSSSVTFSVGDTLIFQYTLNHDVTEVSKTDFDSCTASNPLQPPSTGGMTIISLKTPGSRYFICGTAGHCLNGMQVQINTLLASAPPPTPGTSPSVPPPVPTMLPPPPPTPPTSHPVSSPPPKGSPTPPFTSVPPPRYSLLSPPPPPPSSAPKVNLIYGLKFGLGAMMILFLNH